MDRKYRQRGYQDSGTQESLKSRRVPRSEANREGPRSPRMMGFQKKIRCANCGNGLAALDEIEADSSCPQCGTDLHTCRNCVYFDSASHFECTQPIPERVSPKDRANHCTFFEARTRVEKKTTSASESRTSSDLDPREAFERLFKK